MQSRLAAWYDSASAPLSPAVILQYHQIVCLLQMPSRLHPESSPDLSALYTSSTECIKYLGSWDGVSATVSEPQIIRALTSIASLLYALNEYDVRGANDKGDETWRKGVLDSLTRCRWIMPSFRAKVSSSSSLLKVIDQLNLRLAYKYGADESNETPEAHWTDFTPPAVDGAVDNTELRDLASNLWLNPVKVELVDMEDQ